MQNRWNVPTHLKSCSPWAHLDDVDAESSHETRGLSRLEAFDSRWKVSTPWTNTFSAVDILLVNWLSVVSKCTPAKTIDDVFIVNKTEFESDDCSNGTNNGDLTVKLALDRKGFWLSLSNSANSSRLPCSLRLFQWNSDFNECLAFLVEWSTRQKKFIVRGHQKQSSNVRSIPWLPTGWNEERQRARWRQRKRKRELVGK